MTGRLDGKVALTMAGLHDPEPHRRTILKAVEARTQIDRVMDQERSNKAALAAAS